MLTASSTGNQTRGGAIACLRSKNPIKQAPPLGASTRLSGSDPSNGLDVR